MAIAKAMSLALDRSPAEIPKLFEKEPELIVEWVLRQSLPPEVTFDGLRYIFQSQSESHELTLLCTIWYLNNGQSRGAGLHFRACLNEGTINVSYDYTTESDYPSYDKLWKALYLFSTTGSDEWSWSQSGSRAFSTTSGT